jgi:hypothetical protein
VASITRTVATYQEILGGSVLVDEIRIKYVELVALHNLRWRIVHIIVGLIILVPFKPGVYPEIYVQLASI